jgi:hypothetical protein
MLLRRAKRGASGKALTNIVMKPYWITEKQKQNQFNSGYLTVCVSNAI